MAPSNNTNHRKTTAAKSATKPVVPALPLSYGRRGLPRTNPPHASALPERKANDIVHADGIGAGTTPSTPSTVESTRVDRDDTTVISQTPVQKSLSVNGGADLNGNKSKSTNTDSQGTLPKPETIGSQANGLAHVPQQPHGFGQPSAPHVLENTSSASDTPTPSSIPSRAHHPAGPPEFRAPAPFQRHYHTQGFVPNGDGHRPRSAMLASPRHSHHTHPSNGSLQFGAFHDSNNSSPVPPQSGGFPPPATTMMPDGRPAFHPHAPMSEYPPQAFPYNGEGTAPVVGERFGHPSLVHPPEGYSFQPTQGFGPPTPHHGSHSSAHADEAAPYASFPLNNTSNHPEAHRQQHRLGPSGSHPGFPHPPRALHGPAFPPLPPQVVSQLMDIYMDDFHGYMRGQFQDPTFSDCTLVLRYLDDRSPPIRVPAHKVILARSERLKNKMIADSASHVPNGLVVLLEAEDPFIRSDAFISALQRLYGFPLFSIPDPPPGSNDTQMAGSITDRFDFVLGYAASGYLFGSCPIVVRGLEMACQLLSWDTVEKALHFTVEGTLARDTIDEHVFGDPIDILLIGISNFLVNNFPPNFALDTSVSDPATYSRLPPLPPTASSANQLPATPPQRSQGARENWTSPSAKSHRPQLSKIQFGDMPEEREGAITPSDVPSKASATVPTRSTILSRILLNMPFSLLKKTLESDGQGNVSAWANAEARHQALRSVVEERESRRMNAVAAVKDGLVDDASHIQVMLASPEPASSEAWAVLGWREELIPYGNPDKPCLGRSWTPLRLLSNGGTANLASAAYP